MVAQDFGILPDPDLIEACLGGNETAWEVLLSRYARLVCSIALRYGLSETDAADVFQNVSLRLLENLSTIRDRNYLAGWLTTTTRRECWRVIRRMRATAEPRAPYGLEQIPDPQGIPEEELRQLEHQTLVHGAIEQMGRPCQTLLNLLFYTDPHPSYEQIAQQLGIPAGSIGPNRARCLEKLVRILQRSLFFD